MIGNRYGRLVVTGAAPTRRIGAIQNPHAFFHVICDCGNTNTVRATYLRTGRTVSCGCIRNEATSVRRRTHGDSRSSEYNTWCTMIQRCENPNSTKYPDYGGRGIKVCKRWRTSYANFLEDMGRRPPRQSIDRQNVNGNYTPSNCRWATAKEQRANQRSPT